VPIPISGPVPNPKISGITTGFSTGTWCHYQVYLHLSCGSREKCPRGDAQEGVLPYIPCLSTSVHYRHRLVLVRSITASRSAIQHCIVSSTPAVHGSMHLRCGRYRNITLSIFRINFVKKSTDFHIVIDIHIDEDICSHTVVTFPISLE